MKNLETIFQDLLPKLEVYFMQNLNNVNNFHNAKVQVIAANCLDNYTHLNYGYFLDLREDFCTFKKPNFIHLQKVTGPLMDAVTFALYGNSLEDVIANEDFRKVFDSIIRCFVKFEYNSLGCIVNINTTYEEFVTYMFKKIDRYSLLQKQVHKEFGYRIFAELERKITNENPKFKHMNCMNKENKNEFCQVFIQEFQEVGKEWAKNEAKIEFNNILQKFSLKVVAIGFDPENISPLKFNLLDGKIEGSFKETNSDRTFRGLVFWAGTNGPREKGQQRFHTRYSVKELKAKVK